NQSVEALINNTSLFSIGFSWGGYESLIIPINPTSYRTVTQRKWQRPMIRLHIGLEDASDLIADLEEGFNALRQTHSLSVAK
ncbi:MAG: PLP-dependent transferase, partial [Pseudomonadota bacterium]